MVVPAHRVREAHEGKPPARRPASEKNRIHYAATAEGDDALGVQRIADAMSLKWADHIKDGGGGPFTAREVLSEALGLGLHFLGLQYCGDHTLFDAAAGGDVDVIEIAAPARKSKP